MTRTEQYKINCVCVYWFNVAMHEYNKSNLTFKDSKNLRSCNARVYETEHFYILQSHKTFVAIIDKKSNEVVDMLRHEYEFTRTSSQHISKFIHDYTPYPWNSPRYTWREI